jgi:small-conductance mechanosensitive channel
MTVRKTALLCLPLFIQFCAQAQEPPANVIAGDQPIFAIQTRLGPFSPAERAAAANRKLARLIEDVSISPDAIVLAEQDDTTDIVSNDIVIATITEADAKAAGVKRSVLAVERLRQIKGSVSKVRAEYSYKSLLLGSVYAFLTTLTLVLLLVLLRRLAPRLYAAIERWRGTLMGSLKPQSLEQVSAGRVTAALIQLARICRLAVTLILLYFYIPLVFSFFPWTRSFGYTLLSYVLNPIVSGWAAFLAYLPSLLVIGVIICFSYLAMRVARFVFRELERGTIQWPGFYPEWAMPSYKIVQILIVAFATIVIFPYLPGSDSPAFRGVSIFLGVLFSLGSTSAVSNVIGGLILTYTRAFRIGDRVQIADTVGDIVAKTLLATHVRTIKNVHITIPNSLVAGSHVVNFSTSAQGEGLILHTSVTIGYDAPWRQVHALLIEAAMRTPGVSKDPQPFVLQTALNDFYVAYEINAYTVEPGRMAIIYSDLHQNIQDAFNEAGVEIMSPHYNSIRDGNTTAIPRSYKSS